MVVDNKKCKLAEIKLEVYYIKLYLHLWTDHYVQMPVKKKQDIKSTIIILPIVKAKSISAPKPDKHKQPPLEAQGSASKGPTGFYWAWYSFWMPHG